MYKYISNESICAFYLTMFSLLSPLTHTATMGSSTLILMCCLGLCFISTFYVVIRDNRPICFHFLFLLLFVIGLLFSFDILIRPNAEIFNYIYSFLIYGAFTVFFCAQVVDFNFFLKTYCILSVISGLIMARDPLQDYLWSNTYMEFGFVSMLPAFSGAVILFTVFKYKISGILMLLFFVELVIFANKGSVLAALVLFIIYVSFFRNRRKNNIKKISVFILSILFLYFYYMDILVFFLGIVRDFGFDSYSLRTMQIVFENTSDNVVFDSRLDIWEKALQYFYNNPLLGCGIGFFHSVSGGYEHNILLEVLNSWGIVGFLILFVIIYKCVFVIFNERNFLRQTTIVFFFIISFIPLLTSLTFWAYQPFWALLTFSLIKQKSHPTESMYICVRN